MTRHTNDDYRPEIDGLRAVAVVAVVVFHLNNRWLPGGFLGVDVFFVISGFLITSIVFSQIQADRFSIIGFWKRRIRRLYPALLVMVATVLCVGTFLLVRPERTSLPKHAIATLFSFQNMLLWKNTGGYWDAASENLALLHTWSLSLEEQFYIFLPCLLLLLRRIGRGYERVVLAVLFIASLAASIYFTGIDRSGAFYFLPTRMWELLIGSLLAVSVVRRNSESNSRSASTFQGIGLGMILASFVLIQNDVRFPSYRPLLPCIGTFLLLAFGASQGPVRSLLSAKPIVYVGKISYSLYLWHWPVITFLRFTNPELNVAVAVILSFFFAILSYHFVENPFRYGMRYPRMAWVGAVSFLTSGFLAITLVPSSPLLHGLGNFDTLEAMQRGWEFEATDAIRNAKIPIEARDDEYSNMICVIGSSHARMFCNPAYQFAQECDLKFLSLAVSGIGISETNQEKMLRNADEMNAKRIAIIQKVKPKTLLIAGMWNEESKAAEFDTRFANMLSEFSKLCQQVIVIGQIPCVDSPPGSERAFRRYVVAQHLSGKSLAFNPLSNITVANAKVASIVDALNRTNVEYVDAYSPLMSPSGHMIIAENETFLYSDEFHVNDRGAGLVFHRAILPAMLRLQSSVVK
jgi:peptidoglycan/LPS O-acetylase OafA/YrhL